MQFTHSDSVAVLMSGGLDSAILLGEALRTSAQICPLYVRCGLHWEAVELEYVRRYLEALERPALQQLTILDEPVADLDANHWSVTGRNVPGADTPDEAVFLPGRNVLLLTKSMLWCHRHGVSAVALGVLGSNPFPDATPDFFSAFEKVVNRAVGGSVCIQTPFAQMHKTEVMHLGGDLPLQHSFSCINPSNEQHCGRCNKCQERRNAFRDAGMSDPTEYSK